MSDILKIVEKTICDHNMISKNDKVLVAFSGGSDSVFLLYALYMLSKKYDFSLSAAHLNHKIRSCADDEESFAAEFCKKCNIDFYSKKVDIPTLSKKRGVSTETCGREERYSFFEELKNTYGFTKIATAHHMNDNAETILMHFIRGSAANGLKGIEYIRKGGIIRPLLDISKRDIYDSCEELGLDFVTDKSNFEPVYTRNKVRLSLIPEIEKYNPNFSHTITQNAQLFAEDEEFLNSYAENIFEKHYNKGFPQDVFDEVPVSVKRRIVRLLYKNACGGELSKSYTDSILSLRKGSLSLPMGMTLFLTAGRYMIKKNNSNSEFVYKAQIDETIFIKEYGEYWTIKRVSKKENDVFCTCKNPEFIIRSRRAGDKFFPLGAGGRKSISNLFTDKKIPSPERSRIPILTADNEIVNIGGKYRDERFYKSNVTDFMYKLDIKKQNGSDNF